MSKILRHYIISGRVQGVYYRESTRRKADELGINQGWVQNLADGTVEAMVYAYQEEIDELEKWFWRGPTAARVDHIERLPVANCEEIILSLQEQGNFCVRR